MKTIKKYFPIIVPLLVGLFSSIFVDSSFYKTINKPLLAPPSILFPIVWTILYLLMGISFYLLLSKGNTKENKILFWTQLFLNVLWVFIFFQLHYFLLSFIVIIFLVALVLLLILQLYKYNKWSANLLIPYLLWICFASYLNWGIYLLN